ncbi:MAG TPA: CHAD domain-containing protein [Pseudonocardiaceae bacterium]|nr:CHAD domain-containing protein [Pseudonocardiaceae bacterium]
MTAVATAPGAARQSRRPLTVQALGLPAVERTAGRQDSLTAHIRATVDTQLRVLLAEQASAGRADEPESVHQMRVAARRARVALRMDRGVIGPTTDTLRVELAWLGTLLGGVRDLDVLCERLTTDGADLPESDLPAFGEVLSALLAARSTAADVLVKGLRRQRYRVLLRTMAAEALGQADDAARTDPASLLVKPVRALHLQLAASAQSPSDESWHALRIKVKRVRYAAELAGRLAGRKQRVAFTELVGQAKALQELLGAFQDTVVTEHHLRQLVTAHPGDLTPTGLLVVGRLVERQVAKRNELREQLPAASGELYRVTS